jgi:hypothetical protein
VSGAAFTRGLARNALGLAIARYAQAKVAESWRGGAAPEDMDSITREVAGAEETLNYQLTKEFGPGNTIQEYMEVKQ